jgi:hypothetical protein
MWRKKEAGRAEQQAIWRNVDGVVSLSKDGSTQAGWRSLTRIYRECWLGI